MKNIYFPEEQITRNDLYFLCYMIERIARRLHQPNRYIVNSIDKNEWRHLISVAGVLHSENPLDVEDEWIQEYHLQSGTTNVTDVSEDLETRVPTDLQMGKVYTRLIEDSVQPGEDCVDTMCRVYNDELCDIIDDYDTGAYYEPSYVIARALREGGF